MTSTAAWMLGELQTLGYALKCKLDDLDQRIGGFDNKEGFLTLPRGVYQQLSTDQGGADISILGQTWTWEHRDEAERKYRSLIWMTYRKGFSSIQSRITSDAGWGCLLRTGQMLLANTLVRHRTSFSVHTSGEEIQKAVAQCFRDEPTAPFSIHSMLQIAEPNVKKLTDWWTPTLTAHVLKQLLKQYTGQLGTGLRVAIADHCTLFETTFENEYFPVARAAAAAALSGSSFSLVDQEGLLCGEFGLSNGDGSVLVLVPSRAGTAPDGLLGVIYAPVLKHLLELPQSMGCLGGPPGKSLYVVGVHGSACLVLDPHVMVQPAFTEESDCTGGVLSVDMWTNGKGKLFGMDITQLDPSILLAFYLRNYNDWLALRRALSAFSDENPDLPHMLRIEEGEAQNDAIPDDLLDEIESLESFPDVDRSPSPHQHSNRRRGGSEREEEEEEEAVVDLSSGYPEEDDNSVVVDERDDVGEKKSLSPDGDPRFLGSSSISSASSEPHVFVDTHEDLVFTQYAAPPPTDAIIVDTQKIVHRDDHDE